MVRIAYVLCFYQLMVFVSTLIGRGMLGTNAGVVVDRRTGRKVRNATNAEVSAYNRAQRRSTPIKHTYWTGATLLAILLTLVVGNWYDPVIRSVAETNMYTGRVGWGWNMGTVNLASKWPQPVRTILLILVVVGIGIVTFKVGVARVTGQHQGLCRFVFITNVVMALLAAVSIVIGDAPVGVQPWQFVKSLGVLTVVPNAMPYVFVFQAVLTVIVLIAMHDVSINTPV